MSKTRKRGSRLAAVVIAAVLAASGGVLLAGPANAEPNPGTPVDGGLGDIATETRISQLLNVGSVSGGQNPAVDPAATPYPAVPGVPVAATTTAQAVLKDIHDPTGPIQGLAYCIDLESDTTVGVNYKLGPWTEASVPNLVYVNYILTNYFPNVPSVPAGTIVQKVAAVQSAIWYFTDHFILADTDPVRAATAAIILDAQTNAGGGAPPLPTLTLTPNSAQVPTTGDLVGPFTVGGTAATATLQALGVEVFADAAGTQPLADGDTVALGAQLWMRYLSTTTPQGFRLTSIQSVVQGNVFLYDGSNAGRTTAQKLILAQATDLPIRAGVTATPYAAGSLQITKIITGETAGLQGPLEVTASCSDGETITEYTTTLPAGTGAGSHPMPVISPIPAGAVCTITETADGVNEQVVLVSSTIEPSDVTIIEQETAQVEVTDEYGPAPTPTPTPTPTKTPSAGALPATGASGGLGLGLLAGVLLLAGAGIAVQRRFAKTAR
ncbi:thioester domain-containing protein [Agromyces mediolanus]|uniref:thioester domain-containing protein n=1 Tax=Agromyces mediolanus TaxID=41986 RepID=UPI002041D7FF|nr:thioester domain-containing protein [Agromyces mediolanus]MCM3655834.1 thioester domain-containing protein [Agromyces mediolanus]